MLGSVAKPVADMSNARVLLVTEGMDMKSPDRCHAQLTENSSMQPTNRAG